MKFLKFALLLLLLSGCKQEEPLKIGFVGTLTGKYSSVGVSEMYGAQLAVEKINESGGINGRQVELVIRDDEADPELAVEVDNELKELGVDIIIGHSLSIVAIEAVDNANKNDILLFSPSIGTDSLTGIDDMLLRNVATTYFEGQSMAQGVMESGAENTLIIYNLDNYVSTQHHLKGVEDYFKEIGYSTYTEYGFESDNAEHIKVIQDEIESGQYDSVMIFSTNVDAAIFINLITSNELNMDIHISSWGATGILPLIDTVNTDHVFGYFSFNENSTDPAYLSMKEEYESKFGEDVTMLAVNAYDIVYILKEAIEAADSYDPVVVKEKIIELKSFDGSMGSIIINEFGDTPREHFKVTYVDGETILVR